MKTQVFGREHLNVNKATQDKIISTYNGAEEWRKKLMKIRKAVIRVANRTEDIEEFTDLNFVIGDMNTLVADIDAALRIDSRKQFYFKGHKLTVKIEEYRSGGMAIELIKGKERYMVASVFVDHYPLLPDEVFIKDYSENEGIFAALVEAGVISDLGMNYRNMNVKLAKLEWTHLKKS